jgi:Sec-independent protein translocase protein TatA
MLVILLLALLIFGPKELPKLARAISRAIVFIRESASQEMLVALVLVLLIFGAKLLHR